MSIAGNPLHQDMWRGDGEDNRVTSKERGSSKPFGGVIGAPTGVNTFNLKGFIDRPNEALCLVFRWCILLYIACCQASTFAATCDTRHRSILSSTLWDNSNSRRNGLQAKQRLFADGFCFLYVGFLVVVLNGGDSKILCSIIFPTRDWCSAFYHLRLMVIRVCGPANNTTAVSMTLVSRHRRTTS